MQSGIVLATGAALAALLAPGVAGAQSYNPIRCDTCTSSDDFRARALAAGEGHHLVYNLPANAIEYWVVDDGAGRAAVAELSSGDLQPLKRDPEASDADSADVDGQVASGATLAPADAPSGAPHSITCTEGACKLEL